MLRSFGQHYFVLWLNHPSIFLATSKLEGIRSLSFEKYPDMDTDLVLLLAAEGIPVVGSFREQPWFNSSACKGYTPFEPNFELVPTGSYLMPYPTIQDRQYPFCL